MWKMKNGGSSGRRVMIVMAFLFIFLFPRFSMNCIGYESFTPKVYVVLSYRTVQMIHHPRSLTHTSVWEGERGLECAGRRQLWLGGSCAVRNWRAGVQRPAPAPDPAAGDCCVEAPEGIDGYHLCDSCWKLVCWR